MLVLLYVLNPTASSLRAISQASELAKVRDELGNEEASLGSLSEAGGLFSADLVKPIIGPCLLKSRMLPRTRDGAAFSKRSPPWMALSINALPSNEPAAMGQMRTTPRQRVYS
tara:strand:- start:405 stop:743 length:339 start_codon:yes stop_codon:yes gene_type:complete